MSIPDYPSAMPPGFAASSLDRRAHWRARAEKLAGTLDQAVVIPVYRYRLPIRDGQAQMLPASAFGAQLEQAIWLGHWNEHSVYALDVSDRSSEQWPELQFSDLRGSAMRLDPDHASVLAYARAMVYWHRQHRHCGRCGGPTTIEQAGHVRRCPSCDVEHYPRTDPSMLVMVTDDQDRGLLGRQPGWPPGFWSVLAGFVEPGESIEDAVVREVWEEARIQVTGMRYVASQPWPFPASVLMGFQARGIADTPQVEQDELEAAGWYSRADIVAGLKSRELFLPPPFTLSWRLVEDWFDQDWETPLRELVGLATPGP